MTIYILVDIYDGPLNYLGAFSCKQNAEEEITAIIAENNWGERHHFTIIEQELDKVRDRSWAENPFIHLIGEI